MQEQIGYHTSTNVVVWSNIMAQAIRNIEAGQRFIVVDGKGIGFLDGTIVESIDSLKNTDENTWFGCKWIGGTENYMNKNLRQKVKHLKRFKGKIKWQKKHKKY